MIRVVTYNARPRNLFIDFFNLSVTDKERREEQASILFAMLGRLILFIMREGLEV